MNGYKNSLLAACAALGLGASMSAFAYSNEMVIENKIGSDAVVNSVAFATQENQSFTSGPFTVSANNTKTVVLTKSASMIKGANVTGNGVTVDCSLPNPELKQSPKPWKLVIDQKDNDTKLVVYLTVQGGNENSASLCGTANIPKS